LTYGVMGLGSDYWDVLARASAGEYARASAGYGLSSIKALTPPPEATAAPPDDGGARLAVLYWLSVASRLADAAGDTAASASLPGNARAMTLASMGATHPSGSPFRAWLGQGQKLRHYQILTNAAIKADAAGQQDVGKILRGMTDPAAVRHSQELYGGSRWLPTACKAVGIPAPICDPWKQGAYAPYVAVGFGVVGGLLSLHFWTQRRKKKKPQSRAMTRYL